MEEMIQAYFKSQQTYKDLQVKVSKVTIDGATCVATLKYSGITEFKTLNIWRVMDFVFKMSKSKNDTTKG